MRRLGVCVLARWDKRPISLLFFYPWTDSPCSLKYVLKIRTGTQASPSKVTDWLDHDETLCNL